MISKLIVKWAPIVLSLASAYLWFAGTMAEVKASTPAAKQAGGFTQKSTRTGEVINLLLTVENQGRYNGYVALLMAGAAAAQAGAALPVP
jgi:hypothetical protein